MSSIPTSPSSSTPQITLPCEVTKTIVFKVSTIEDYNYVSSSKVEDDFISDVKNFSLDIEVEIISVDGVRIS